MSDNEAAIKRLEKELVEAKETADTAKERIRNIRARLRQLQAGSNFPDPNYMLDFVMMQMGVKNDAEFCRVTHTHPTALSRTRAREMAVSSPLMIAIHEETGLTTLEIKALIEQDRDAKKTLLGKAHARQNAA